VDGTAPVQLGTGYSLTITRAAIGYQSTGTFNHSGGKHAISEALYVGWSSAANGTYNVNGGGG